MQLEPGSEDERRLIAQLNRLMPSEMRQAFDNPEVEEISLNADGRLWVKSIVDNPVVVGRMEFTQAEGLMKTLASLLDEPIRRDYPLISGELPETGARFMGILPSVTSGPAFSIRIPTIRQLTLDEHVELGAMEPATAALLRRAVVDHRNILLSGDTGSGKTTVANTLIAEMVRAYPHERVFILEDTLEIRCPAENKLNLRQRPTVPMFALLQATLRMRPDRIIVGEVRGREALELLRAWGTGHPGGVCTMHASNAAAALPQLELLVSAHPDAPSEKRIGQVVAQNVDIVVHMTRRGDQRRVTEVLQVVNYEWPNYITQPLYGETT